MLWLFCTPFKCVFSSLRAWCQIRSWISSMFACEHFVLSPCVSYRVEVVSLGRGEERRLFELLFWLKDTCKDIPLRLLQVYLPTIHTLFWGRPLCKEMRVLHRYLDLLEWLWEENWSVHVLSAFLLLIFGRKWKSLVWVEVKVPRPTKGFPWLMRFLRGVEEGSNLCKPCVKRREKARYDSKIIRYYVEPEW